VTVPNFEVGHGEGVCDHRAEGQLRQPEDLPRQGQIPRRVGKKITGTSRRKFKPNLQKVRMVVDGETKRVWVSAAAIRSGLVQKPVKKQPFSMQSV
jgi:ribosomal protein L28